MLLITEQIDKEDFKKYAKELYNYALTILNKIDRAPKIYLNHNLKNADDMFGKTGFYDPESEEIHLFITDRHPKDILRSFAHELVHHEQNCRGDNKNLDLSKTGTDPAYASHDQGLREMEREAFERGNMIFRDWCDMKKIEIKKEKENLMSESKDNKETNKHPHEDLFKEKDRLFKERMNSHEELVYQELLKRFIGEKNNGG